MRFMNALQSQNFKTVRCTGISAVSPGRGMEQIRHLDTLLGIDKLEDDPMDQCCGTAVALKIFARA